MAYAVNKLGKMETTPGLMATLITAYGNGASLGTLRWLDPEVNDFLTKAEQGGRANQVMGANFVGQGTMQTLINLLTGGAGGGMLARGAANFAAGAVPSAVAGATSAKVAGQDPTAGAATSGVIGGALNTLAGPATQAVMGGLRRIAPFLNKFLLGSELDAGENLMRRELGAAKGVDGAPSYSKSDINSAVKQWRAAQVKAAVDNYVSPIQAKVQQMVGNGLPTKDVQAATDKVAAQLLKKQGYSPAQIAEIQKAATEGRAVDNTVMATPQASAGQPGQSAPPPASVTQPAALTTSVGPGTPSPAQQAAAAASPIGQPSEPTGPGMGRPAADYNQPPAAPLSQAIDAQRSLTAAGKPGEAAQALRKGIDAKVAAMGDSEMKGWARWATRNKADAAKSDLWKGIQAKITASGGRVTSSGQIVDTNFLRTMQLPPTASIDQVMQAFEQKSGQPLTQEARDQILQRYYR